MSQTPPSIFVSFSRSDAALALLFERLEAQAFEVWNYDRFSARVPMTAVLLDHLADRLRAASCFVALVSRDAFTNTHSCWEVEHALALHRSGGLSIGVFVDDRLNDPIAGWPAPYAGLSKFRHVRVDLHSRESIARAVQDLCSSLHLEYRPYRSEHGRLQILGRVYDELRTVVGSSGRERDSFVRLVHLIEQAHVASEQQREADFTRLLQLILITAEHEYAGRQLYYVSVLRGVYLARIGEPSQALAVLQKVQADGLSHDAALSSALAYVHYLLEDWATALVHYRDASTRWGSDVSELTSALLCRLRIGSSVDVEAEFKVIDGARKYPGDDAWIACSRAIAYRLVGDWQKALPILVELAQHVEDPSVLAEVSRQLASLTMSTPLVPRDAGICLMSIARRLPDSEPVLQSQATYYFATQEAESCRSACDALARRFAKDPLSVFVAMRGFSGFAAHEQAEQLARAFLEHTPLPSTPFASYVSGAARWILGDPQAEFDFQRSTGNCRYEKCLTRRT